PPAMATEFSLQLFVTEWEGALELKLLYQRERYSEARMACFLEQYEAMLQQGIRHADGCIGAFDLQTARSRRLLPDPSVPLEQPAQMALPHSIAAWVARTPHQTALAQGDMRLSYAELGVGMTALAAYLRAAGCTAEQVVAVLGPRSPGVVVAMAGVLLA